MARLLLSLPSDRSVFYKLECENAVVAWKIQGRLLAERKIGILMFKPPDFLADLGAGYDLVLLIPPNIT